MIEQGLVKLVQASSTVSAICPTGGLFVELEKDQALPGWTYRFFSDHPEETLTTIGGLTRRRVQIDCYGTSGSDVIRLAAAINQVLHGYRGTLTDTDSTVVDSISRSDLMDFFDDARRSYRRMLEFEIWFYQP